MIKFSLAMLVLCIFLVTHVNAYVTYNTSIDVQSLNNIGGYDKTDLPNELRTHADYQKIISEKEGLGDAYSFIITLCALLGLIALMFGVMGAVSDLKFGLILLSFGTILIIISCGIGSISGDNDKEIARLKIADENSRPKNITPAYSYNETTIQRIASLNDGSSTNPMNVDVESRGRSGIFFTMWRERTVVSGGGTVLSYYFYKVMPNEEYMISSIPADGVYLREDGDNDPRIETIIRYYMEEKKVYLDTNETIGGRLSSKVTEKIIIHVPKGTVIRDFVADAKN